MLESSAITASDIMSRAPVTATPETPLRVVIRQMLEGGFSGMPVVDEAGRAIGMITEGDLIRWTEEQAPRARWWLDMLAEGNDLADEFKRALKDQHASVRAVMTKDIVGVSPETPARDIAKMLSTHHIKRVPVLQDGKPVGMITRRDLIRALLETMK